ncbi:hypothetical protein N7539_008811 [Penicillium diatomitis]|uniref:Uncharacterized protein n=1 Tax=Penicillium diatomitis TaxID=2819901 RepID=A0A9W9WQN8_9EURO|nr:uncharacterized protein N7539_008811 [Penicillium diatomitis]KAJ5471868.1 hypothetical protein N7539_008811 [Penicillium diatomitis]
MPYRKEEYIRFNSGSIKRSNISGPVQLISTTDMLAYDTPDILPYTSSSSSSLRSGDDFDTGSPQSYSSITTPDESPGDPFPVNNNAGSYFPKRSATVTSQSRSSNDAPLIPQQALSHTKRSHQELARQRSQHGISPPPLVAPRSNPTIRASQDVPFTDNHPFSKELAQIDKVAEEFSATHVTDEEEILLQRKGLKKFSVEDYLSEIESVYRSVFDDPVRPVSVSAWL